MTQSYYVLKIQYVNRPAETRNVAEPTITLGRESGDIVLGDPQSSGRHAEISFAHGQVRVRDLGSTNGTWLDGQRQTEFVLMPGQVFIAGQTQIQLLAVHGPQPQAAGGGRTMIAMGAPPPGAVPAQRAPAGWGPPPRPVGGAPAAMSVPGSIAGRPPQPAAGTPPAEGASPQRAGWEPATPMQRAAPAQPEWSGPPVHAAWGGTPSAGASPASSPGYPPPSGPGYPPPSGPGYPPPSSPGYPPPSGPGYPPPSGPGYPPPSSPVAGPPVPVPVGPPLPVVPAQVPASAYVPQTTANTGGGVRPTFSATGGELFVTVLVHGLLTMITAGIYLPWFLCKLQALMMSKTSVGPTRRGPIQLSFHGRGGELFLTVVVGYLLTLFTLGIYYAWFLCKLVRFFSDNTYGHAADGTTYRFRFAGTGGELFVTVLVHGLLTAITAGIYLPWFICKLNQIVASKIAIEENGQVVGNFGFEGKGGELFVTFFVGYLLTIITIGIYAAWFQVKLMRFFARGARVNVYGATYAGDFAGTGGEYFVLNLVGSLLTLITLGIYMAWYIVKVTRFQYENHVFRVVGPAAHAFQPQQPAQM